ncbi:hypothetical protein [Plantactinospora endophytica]|uniref:HTH luxR-type domain-containing protein n=1 Tax=Plantactinospora endophytica TaxID=673535 RepID=A0ABQ4E288_9ACTN|nr:hypothetical protein [Plantactinospora endophytica]GIG88797.1 hypothetical protein Pen02_37330 [Plantactinospora endophytica]
MSGLPPATPNVVRDVTQFARTAQQVDAPAELLSQLRRVVPAVQAGWLALLDDRHGRYAEIASFGYDTRTRDYFGTTPLLEQIELVGLASSPEPQSARDSPIPLGDLPIWGEYYFPAGFSGGVAVGLFTPDHRHVGVLVMCTDDAGRPSDAERDLVGALAPRIATAVDPVRSLAVLAQVVRDAQAGAVLTECGEVRPLPGLSGHPLLEPDSALPGVALRQAGEGGGSASFRWPVSGKTNEPDDCGGLLQATVLACPTGPPHVVGVLVLSPVPAGRSVLTRRELVLVGLLLEGWSDQRIAVGLDLPVYSVVETAVRVTAKLGAPDRHSALVRAARGGLFIPYQPGRPPPA